MTLIAPSGALSDIEIVGASFGFLLLNIVLVFPAYFAISWISSVLFDPEAKRGHFLHSDLRFYVLLVLISVFTGTTAGVAVERDWFFRFAKWVPFLDIPIQDSTRHPFDRILLQNQTGLHSYRDPSPDGRFYSKDQANHTNQAYARIVLSNGSVYEGWPLYFDARRSDAQIYLSPACRMSSVDGEVMPIAGPGALIYERDIREIIFLDIRRSACSSFWYTHPDQRDNLPALADMVFFGGGTDPSEVYDNEDP